VENYKNRVNILLVEDNLANVELTREAFERCVTPVRMEVMHNGMDALHYLRNVPDSLPDMILLDLNLPHWNGISFLKEIKSDHTLKRIPVIVLTTSSAEKDVTESYNLHANCYIVKPIDIDHFFEKIKHLEVFWFDTVLLPTRA